MNFFLLMCITLVFVGLVTQETITQTDLHLVYIGHNRYNSYTFFQAMKTKIKLSILSLVSMT